MRFSRNKTEGEPLTDDDFCPNCYLPLTKKNQLVTLTTIAATDDADTIENVYCDTCFDQLP